MLGANDEQRISASRRKLTQAIEQDRLISPQVKSLLVVYSSDLCAHIAFLLFYSSDLYMCPLFLVRIRPDLTAAVKIFPQVHRNYGMG